MGVMIRQVPGHGPPQAQMSDAVPQSTDASRALAAHAEEVAAILAALPMGRSLPAAGRLAVLWTADPAVPAEPDDPEVTALARSASRLPRPQAGARRLPTEGLRKLLLATARAGRANAMPMSWHTMMEFEPPLVGCVLSASHVTWDDLMATRECVLAIPTVEIARKVVACGNTSGAKVDKFARFGLTALPASRVRAPLVAECYEKHGKSTQAMAKMTMISDPDLGTVIDTEAIIDRDGKAVEAKLDECMRDTIDSLGLPPLGKPGKLKVQYTFQITE